MSTKSSMLLTGDYNEHWYKDCAEPLKVEGGRYYDAISLEFDKRNIRIDLNDTDDLAITLTNPSCELFQTLNKLDYLHTINETYKGYDAGKLTATECFVILGKVYKSMAEDFERHIKIR